MFQYYFFTNFLSHNYLVDIQIFLRMSLKMEYMYTEFLVPAELLYMYSQAEKLETEKQARLEASAKKS